tara:strand:- start:181 stop:363 length:183 start_codon:yes stop_codon:yes gene_type:complete
MRTEPGRGERLAHSSGTVTTKAMRSSHAIVEIPKGATNSAKTPTIHGATKIVYERLLSAG